MMMMTDAVLPDPDSGFAVIRDLGGNEYRAVYDAFYN
jgi:hypothetical protein